MAKYFEMKVGNTTVRAELLTKEAPKICRAFQRSLPVKSFGVNAKFAGDETIAMLPFYADHENLVGSVSPGDIGYYPTRQTLCVFYGKIMPFAGVTLFARVVPDDLKKSQEVGKQILEAGSLPMTISLPGKSTRAPATTTSDIKAVSILDQALKKVWETEPREVKELRSFKRPPMGNVPCVMYANFDLFWATENLLTARELAQDGLTASQAGTVTAALIRRSKSRIAHWGFDEASTVLERTAEEVEKMRSRKQVIETIDATVLYIDRLQS
ncbi:MAG: cyclophilin-like fold protein, partial [Chloroflexi bacterium]|nr:cyclophilin-like fold protein [Chloroflexota bacterium]